MSALDPFISNPANSVPSAFVGASVDSNSPPESCESALAQLFELADCSGSNLARRANLAAGAGPEPLLLPAPAAFFPDICELLAYANGRRFYDATRAEVTDSPPLFLSNPSFEFTQSVRMRGGVT